MPAQLIRPTEPLATLCTPKRLVPRMRPHMLGQIAALGKRLSTPRERADERLAPRVDPLVDRQRSSYAERFPTPGVVAHVRSFQGVRSHVLRQGVLLAEAFAALGAFERSISGVGLDVTKNFLLLREFLSGRMTRATDPSTFVFRFPGSYVRRFNVVRQSGVGVELGGTSLPSTKQFLGFAAVGSTATGIAALALLAARPRGKGRSAIFGAGH